MSHKMINISAKPKRERSKGENDDAIQIRVEARQKRAKIRNRLKARRNGATIRMRVKATQIERKLSTN